MRIYRFDLASKRIATMDSPTGGAVPPVFAGVVVTSRPYPAEVDEAVDASAVLSRMLDLTPPLDSIDPLAQLVSGALPQILLSTTVPPEAIDPTGTIVAGELRQILLSTIVPPEAIDPAGTIVAGELRQILITTVMVPEGIDGQATLVAGTLA